MGCLKISGAKVIATNEGSELESTTGSERERRLGLHLAVVEEEEPNKHEADGPEPGHHVAGAVFGGKAKLQPARPSGDDSESGERRVAQFGEDFFFDVAKAV